MRWTWVKYTSAEWFIYSLIPEPIYWGQAQDRLRIMTPMTVERRDV